MGRLFLPAGTNLCRHPHDFPSATHAEAVKSATATQTVTDTADGVKMTFTCSKLNDFANYLFVNTQATYTIADWGISVGDVVTFSFDVDAALTGATTCRSQILCWDAGWTPTGLNEANYLSGDGQRISNTYTIPAGTVNIGFYPVVMYGSLVGDAVGTGEATVNNILIEKSAFPTPYFDGDTDDSLNESTYAWTGTANASTSTRAKSVLKFDAASNLGPIGTVAIKCSSPYPAASPWVWGTASLDGPFMTLTDAGAQTYMTGGAGGASGVAHTNEVDTYYTIVSRWSDADNTADINMTNDDNPNGLDGGQSATVFTNPATDILEFVPLGRAATVGVTLISTQRKSDAWVDAIQANNGAVFDDIARLKRDFMAPGDVLFTGNEVNGSHIYTKGS